MAENRTGKCGSTGPCNDRDRHGFCMIDSPCGDRYFMLGRKPTPVSQKIRHDVIQYIEERIHSLRGDWQKREEKIFETWVSDLKFFHDLIRELRTDIRNLRDEMEELWGKINELEAE